MSLEFAPDGKTFAAGRYDGSLEIYNVGQLSSAPAHQARTLAPNAIH
jgi:WD40 repeat protein